MDVLAPSSSSAVERALGLLEDHRRPAELRGADSYLDLLDEQAAAIQSRVSRRTMGSRFVPPIYERFSRPLVARIAMGRHNPGAEGEHRLALEMLGLGAGDRVLDVACGPGNFTRDFAAAVGAQGLVVGVDASKAMLAYAAHTAATPTTAYIRCDAAALPFRAESFDAICCFGALHLFKQPQQALDEIVRVLTPGGRLALLAARLDLEEGRRLRILRRLLPILTGMRPFARDELPQALRERGLVEVESQIAGGAQFVSARKPAG